METITQLGNVTLSVMTRVDGMVADLQRQHAGDEAGKAITEAMTVLREIHRTVKALNRSDVAENLGDTLDAVRFAGVRVGKVVERLDGDNGLLAAARRALLAIDDVGQNLTGEDARALRDGSPSSARQPRRSGAWPTSSIANPMCWSKGAPGGRRGDPPSLCRRRRGPRSPVRARANVGVRSRLAGEDARRAFWYIAGNASARRCRLRRDAERRVSSELGGVTSEERTSGRASTSAMGSTAWSRGTRTVAGQSAQSTTCDGRLAGSYSKGAPSVVC